MAKASSATQADTIDPIRMLTEDHREVSKLFETFEQIKHDDEKQDLKAAIVEQICAALRVHTDLEEEVFYPALRAGVEQDLLDEAIVEHDGAKRLVDELEDADPSEELYDAKVTVLGEYVRHHVKEEEEDMFRQAQAAKGVDLAALGRAMAERRRELEEEYGLTDEADDLQEADSRAE